MSMNEGDIYVNYGHVNNVEDALAAADQQINAVLSNLNQMVGTLRASWAGVSEEEYTTVQARWNNDTSDMQNFLNQHKVTLGEMAYNYGNTDGNLAIQWSEIR
jgi:WXG100 family type VII secretion target